MYFISSGYYEVLFQRPQHDGDPTPLAHLLAVYARVALDDDGSRGGRGARAGDALSHAPGRAAVHPRTGTGDVRRAPGMKRTGGAPQTTLSDLFHV